MAGVQETRSGTRVKPNAVILHGRLEEGIPLFLHHSERTNLTFEGSQSFSSGLVELRHRLAQGGPTP